MKLAEFCDLEINVGKAYALGLIYPLMKYGQKASIKYIVGCVNHNSVEPEDLASHFNSTLRLLTNYDLKSLDIKSNQSADCPMIEGNNGYRVNSKKGFSIYMGTDNLSKEQIEELLTLEVKKIKTSTNEIKRSFAKGCFDGRSSWDTTYHLLAIDVDRNYQKQDLIASIFFDIGIDLNKNRRDADHDKNDQLRIKKNCIKKFYKEIGFDSTLRKRIVGEAIIELCLY